MNLKKLTKRGCIVATKEEPSQEDNKTVRGAPHYVLNETPSTYTIL